MRSRLFFHCKCFLSLFNGFSLLIHVFRERRRCSGGAFLSLTLPISIVLTPILHFFF